MKRIMIAAIVAALAGCATSTIDPYAMAEAQQPLLCGNKSQCDTYWQRAQVWVSTNGGYKIQTATDAVIQTYGPLGSRVELAHQVMRIPNEDGSARIGIISRCANMFGCSPEPYRAAVDFKRFVRGN